MADIVRVQVELLTPEAFAPFGEVLSARDDPPDFIGFESVGWRSMFSCQSEPEVMFYRSHYSGLRFHSLERHFQVSQAFIPLGRVPAVIAVAAPGEEPPDPQDVHGFLLDGTAGYILHPGTWHAPDRYPLYPPESDVVMITDRDTQNEVATQPSDEWRLSQLVDYEEKGSVTFEFEL